MFLFLEKISLSAMLFENCNLMAIVNYVQLQFYFTDLYDLLFGFDILKGTSLRDFSVSTINERVARKFHPRPYSELV